MNLASSLLTFAQGAGTADFIRAFGPVVIIFVIFYFLLIAPMRKRQKALQELVESLKKGDKVVTNGGVYGEIAALEDKVVHLKVADKVRIRIARSSIAGLEETPGQEESK